MSSDPGFLAGIFGGGTGALALIAGWLKLRGSRQERFEKRWDEKMLMLEAKVEECEKERAQVTVLVMSVRMLAAEMQSRDRTNPILKQVAAALGALPVTTNSKIDELVRQLNEVPFDISREEYRARRTGRRR